jgi:hypothetical protein
MDGRTIIGHNSSRGFDWGEDPLRLQAALLSELGFAADVSRTGFGSAEEDFGFVYSVSVPSMDGSIHLLEPVTKGGFSTPIYLPVGSNGINDLSISGFFNGTADITFSISINKTVFDVDWFVWTSHGTVRPARPIVPGTPILLEDGLHVIFDAAKGHHIGDSWVFSAVYVGSSLPSTATIVSDIVASARPDLQQLVLDRGYAGKAFEAVDVFRVPPSFTVQSQDILVMQLYSATSNSGASPSFRFDGSWDYFGVKPFHTSCFPWNANDFEIENELNEIFADFCDPSDVCVDVTRGVDPVNYPNGYVYSIYFENFRFYEGSLFSNISVNLLDCSTTPGVLRANLSVVNSPAAHYPFTSQSVPLARSTDSTIIARYPQISVSQVPIFKVNGNMWKVTFDSNLGDLPLMGSQSNADLSENTELHVYEVVAGDNPRSAVLTNLSTGIEYYARVNSYTRGYEHGYGPYSNVDSSIPSGVPPAAKFFSSNEVLAVNEVQEIFVGAAHVQEVQTVTTSAVGYSGVQEVVVTAPEGSQVDGSVAIRFPSIQIVSVGSLGTSSLTGFFSIKYSYYNFVNASVIFTETTQCLPVTSSARQVELALEALGGVDDVEVVRSGTGGYTDSYGYQWSISFVGNLVAGKVQPLRVGYGVSSSSCSGAVPSTVEITVQDAYANDPVGVDTEVQTVTVAANDFFVEGGYILDFGGYVTDCINWNATADEMKSSLERLPNIDYVYVERFGNGLPSSNFGYSYSVYFTGNALHPRSSSGALPPLIPDYSVAFCAPFAHFSDGIRVDFSPSEASVAVSRIRARGFNLPANATSDDIMREFDLLPAYVNIYDVLRSLSDDQSGFQWSIVYDLSMSNSPPLVCGGDSVFQSSNAVCSFSTLIQANYIGGYFLIENSNPLPANVEADVMRNELQLLEGFGNVSVVRSGPDFQGGYTWTITWLTVNGDVPQVSLTSLLTGSNVALAVETVHNGNSLSGSYSLDFNGQSVIVPFDASSAVLQSLLEPITRDIVVTRTTSTSEGGSSYLVTFLALPGDLPLLSPSYVGTLLGKGAAVRVLEVVKGAIASGSSLSISYQAPLHCSYSKTEVGNCGSPIDSYALEVGDTKGSISQIVSIDVTYEVQYVRTGARSLFDSVFFSGVDVSGFFQLSYNGILTGPIASSASAQDLRDAVESLPDIDSVSVRRELSSELLPFKVNAVPGETFISCYSSCEFNEIPAGDLILVGGSWYRVLFAYGESNSKLPLALANDSTVSTSYNGPTLVGGAIYRWARGFDYEVTFLSVRTDVVLPLSSPLPGLNPDSATVSIRPRDCVSCVYVQGLQVLKDYSLRLRGHNSQGFGQYSTTGKLFAFACRYFLIFLFLFLLCRWYSK